MILSLQTNHDIGLFCFCKLGRNNGFKDNVAYSRDHALLEWSTKGIAIIPDAIVSKLNTDSDWHKAIAIIIKLC